jgi:hypothetical protein
MTSRSIAKATFFLAAISTIMLLLAAGHAQAALFFSFEARESYEDNAAGIVTDGGGVDDRGGETGRVSPMLWLRANDEEERRDRDGERDDLLGAGGGARAQGDFATELYADIGTLHGLEGDRSLIVMASAQRTAYARFNEFDFTILRLSGGLAQQFTEIVSARLTLNAKAKYYDNPLRDSTAAGLTASLRERLGPSVRLRQFYDFERNSADSAIYSYYRHLIGLSASFDLTPALILDVGYSYLLQDYDEPASSRVTTGTLSAELERILGRGWGLFAGYDREMSVDDTSGLSWTNNILSVGIRYLY